MLTDQEERVSAAMEIKPISTASARATGLALALDDGTRKSHSMAENTAFVTGFFKGISTRPAFSQLVASLYFVYSAMERAFDACDDESVKALDDPALRRVPALEEDMSYFFGEGWREEVKPTAATRRYCERIEAVARDEPELLIAHMYTRYLGDLFGGQMMGGMARSSLKLAPEYGTRFYEFDDIPSAKPFIEEWYKRLNALSLSEARQSEIVAEANRVFTLNIEIFEELQGGKRAVVKAMWGVLRSTLREKLLGR